MLTQAKATDSDVSLSAVTPQKPRALILQAVSKLEKIDGALQELSSFWSNLEVCSSFSKRRCLFSYKCIAFLQVIVQLLLQKTDHGEVACDAGQCAYLHLPRAS